MKIKALLKATLSYLSFSSSTPKKSANSAKRNKPQAKKSHTTKTDNQVQPRPYRGTSITFEECACDVVKAIAEKRFLVSEGNTPMLPLSGCDAPKCNCKYMHYDDRREEGEDRRLFAALKTDLYDETGSSNRRSKKRGRRK
ncbi:MAG: hypothetical protein ACI9JM_003234 [Halioglobus sp.]|jgi:hypothetical protein